MPKFVDYTGDQEVKDIMERYLERFPQMFEGFDTSKIGFVMTAKKKSKEPLKLHCVGYPMDVFCGQVYIVEAFKTFWKKLDEKRRNLAVFRLMCSIPDGAFDEASKHFGKRLQPEIRMYMKEYAACGGVPNWMDNPSAADPMQRTTEDIAEDVPEVGAGGVDGDGDEVVREPVTAESVAEAGSN